MLSVPQPIHLASRRERLAPVRKTERFTWTPEAQEALDKLKVSLTPAPILTPPIGSEPLYLYVAATTQVVSKAIVVERQ